MSLAEEIPVAHYEPHTGTEYFPPAAIRTPPQPREDFTKGMQMLVKNVREHGVIQPISIFIDPDTGEPTLIAGGRRLIAAKEAGLRTIPCYVVAKPDPQQLLVLQLIENLHRQDLNPIEQGNAYRRMLDASYSETEVARILAVAVSTVSRALSLLSLQPSLQEKVKSGELLPGHARELVKHPDPAVREEIACRIKEDGLSCQQTAKLVARMMKQPKRARPKKQPRTFKLGSFEAVIRPNRISLAPAGASKKPRSDEEIVTALELLLARLKDELAQRQARSPA